MKNKIQLSNVTIDRYGNLCATTQMNIKGGKGLHVQQTAVCEPALFVEEVPQLFEGYNFYNIAFLYSHSRCRVNKDLFRRAI